MAVVKSPFAGLPIGWEVLFTVALAVITGMFLWTVLLFVRGRHAAARPPPVPPDGTDRFVWVFLVPALNEELTIRDSLDRLLAIELERRRILVIDDGSDDRTPEILRRIEHPDLFVLRRDPPEAREGKAAALNHGYRALEGLLGGDVDREHVIVVIVDADGRLDPSAPAYVAAHFENPCVGGVQGLVRVYNRGGLLTWLQDLEFSVYGHLFQAGRDDWGTAGMGGNGQFNRLSALEQVDEGRGPWRHRLTEDQDLGLRLIAAGWKGRQELRATVDQQGPPRFRPLLRQRTRWSQGNLQAIGLAGAVWGAPFPVGARVELLAYPLMPFFQGIVGAAMVGAVILALTGVASFWHGGPTWLLIVFYVLAFGGTILGCIAGRASRGARGWIAGFLLGHVYALYTWILWPVLARSLGRQLISRQAWSKTQREPVPTTMDPTSL